MGRDNTESTANPISRVTSRVVPVTRVKRDKSASIEPRMNQLRRALASLAAAAQSPPLQHRVEFPIPGIGTLRTTTLHKFELYDDPAEHRPGFTLAYVHVGPRPLKHVTESEQVHKALRKMLFGYELEFRSASSEMAHKIEVEAQVSAQVSVRADADGKSIAVTLRNVDVLGSTTYRWLPEQVDRKLVDAIVALVSDGARDLYAIVTALPRRR